MQIYKVGGCIRDKLLGLPVNDNDFVVVGSTPEEMIKLGFKAVGHDFPVFIHPKTKEEYALARCEKKVASGYRGFTFQTTPDISLAEDLKRRDITINAIAEDEHGQLIDPFHGLTDLKKKIIRHVSNSFVEDPLRILRVARFSAKLNFQIAKDTISLMAQIVKSGELQSLSDERIWNEIHKALMTEDSSIFFKTLHKVGALQQLLPELTTFVENQANIALFQNIAPRMHMAKYPIEKRFAVLCYFVSDTYTIAETKQFIANTYLSNQCKTLAKLLVTYYNPILMLNNLSKDDIYSLIKSLDPIRRRERYLDFIDLVYLIAADKNDTKTRNHLELIKKIIDKFSRIKYEQIKQDNPETFIDNVYKCKIKIIEQIISDFPEA